MSWLDRSYRQGFKNLSYQAGLAEFDSVALARHWKALGADLVYMDALTPQGSLYQSKLLSRPPTLGDRDLCAPFIAECRKLGMRAGAYVVPLDLRPLLEGHPDWLQTKTDGTPHAAGSYGCWNSPYFDRVCAAVKDLFARYAFDAAFFDGLLSRHGVCHCPYCAEQYRAAFKSDLPKAHDRSDPNFQRYVLWKKETFSAACRKLAAACRAGRPRLVLTSNTPTTWCGWCAVQPPESFDAFDAACVEIHPGFLDVSLPGYAHASSTATLAYMLGYTRAQANNLPKVQAYNAVGDYHRGVSSRIDIDIQLELKTTVAFGGLPCVQFEPPILRDAFAYVQACEPYLTNTQPLGWAGLLASQDSCDAQHNDQEVRFFEDLKGSFHALFDLRVPVHFVSGREAARRLPRSMDVLVLSDAGYLTKAQADEIRRYVRAGGGLVATAQSSLLGADGQPGADFSLADVFGVHAAGPARSYPHQVAFEPIRKHHVRFEEGEPWWASTVQPWINLEAGDRAAEQDYAMVSADAQRVFAPVQPIRAAESARTLAWMVEQDEQGQEVERWPAIVEHRFGRGRVIYLAWRFGEFYARMPHVPWRRVMETALRRVAAHPAPVEVLGPQCVSVASWIQKSQRRWVIHLINDLDENGRPRARMTPYDASPAWPGSQPRTRTIPVDGVELILRKRGLQKIELPLEGRTLQAKSTTDGYRVKVGRLGQHRLLVLTWVKN